MARNTLMTPRLQRLLTDTRSKARRLTKGLRSGRKGPALLLAALAGLVVTALIRTATVRADTIVYQYDPAGRPSISIITRGNVATTTNYTYDADGNLKSVVSSSTLVATPTATATPTPTLTPTPTSTATATPTLTPTVTPTLTATPTATTTATPTPTATPTGIATPGSFAVTGSVSAPAGKYPQFELQNPANSGVNLVVGPVQLWTSASSEVGFVYESSYTLTQNAYAGQNTSAGSPLPVATDDVIAASSAPGGAAFNMQTPAAQPFTLNLPVVAVIPPGGGLLITDVTAGDQMSVSITYSQVSN